MRKAFKNIHINIMGEGGGGGGGGGEMYERDGFVKFI